MNDTFLHIVDYSRTMLIEQVMTIIGRSSRKPRDTRNRLERMTPERLRKVHSALIKRISESTPHHHLN